MCGIAGTYGFTNKKLLKKFSSDLLHRGPDGEGFYNGKLVGLLSRRLAIVDRKGGVQPIYNEDKSIVVVFNGEIYNHKELRKELEKYGHSFRTESDTEVIVHSYEQWGEGCFDMFNGMFGIALYDIKKETLLLIRDQFGIKPLYYAFLNDTERKNSTKKVVFSSEITPLIRSKLIRAVPNDRMLYRYLALRMHENANDTFFENVYKVMPGQLLKISQLITETIYYSSLKKTLDNAAESSSDADIKPNTVNKFKKLFTKAVLERMTAEVPVGIALSGGLDSTSVASVMNDYHQAKPRGSASLGENVYSYSAIFPKSINNEANQIESVHNRFPGLLRHDIFPTSEEFLLDLNDFIRTQEEPTISTGAYTEYKIMQKASECVTVLLEGQGGDEIMSGYPGYGLVYLRELFHKKEFYKAAYLSWVLRASLSRYLINNLRYKLGLRKKTSPRSILTSSLLAKHKRERVYYESSNLKKLLLQDIFEYSLQALLRYADRNSMRFSVEARVPFLDAELIKYLFSLSNSAFISPVGMKSIMRQSMKDTLPSPVLNKKEKIGFSVPEGEWLKKLETYVMEIVNSKSFSDRPYFNNKNVKEMIENFMAGKTDDGLLIWRIINCELWMREFIDTGVRKSRRIAISKKYERKYHGAN